MEWIENMKILRNVIAPHLLVMMAVLLSAPAWAATTVTVTNTNDNGAGSLRQAIIDAAPDDTINLPAGLITLTSGELFIDKQEAVPPGTPQKILMISGPGADNLTIRTAGGNSRIFNVASGAVHISGLTVRDGHADFGGGINNEGTLE